MSRAVRCVTVTFSDTRTTEDDEGGSLLRELLGQAGHEVLLHLIAREEGPAVEEALDRALAVEGVQAVITTGGTGLAPRDIAAEAAERRLTKQLPGFGEAFRRLSWDEVGPRSILSRAVAGAAGGRLLVALPGSPRAVRLALSGVLLPVLVHAVDLLEGRTHHPRGQGLSVGERRGS